MCTILFACTHKFTILNMPIFISWFKYWTTTCVAWTKTPTSLELHKFRDLKFVHVITLAVLPITQGHCKLFVLPSAVRLLHNHQLGAFLWFAILFDLRRQTCMTLSVQTHGTDATFCPPHWWVVITITRTNKLADRPLSTCQLTRALLGWCRNSCKCVRAHEPCFTGLEK